MSRFSIVLLCFGVIAAHADLQNGGAIKVTITPSDVVEEGAKWRLDGGRWRRSGKKIKGLAPGAHQVSFKRVSGWTKPKNLSVPVTIGETTKRRGRYEIPSPIGTVTADFTADTTFGDMGLIVQFTESSTATNGPVLSWNWDFGDPSSGIANASSEPNPTHVYEEPGRYSVTLTAANANGQDTEVKDEFILVYEPASTFEATETVIDVTATIGPDGGTLLAPEGSPVAGVSVQFPPGALTEEVEVRLGHNPGVLTLVSGVDADQIGVPIVLECDEQLFNKLVYITFTYGEDEHDFVFPFQVDSTGLLQPCDIEVFDVDSHTMTFKTQSPGIFVLIASNESSVDNSKDDENYHDTWFRVAQDGFSVINLSIQDFPRGRCYGFAEFARWYYIENGGGLSKLGTTPLQPEPGELPLVGQDAIAARAHNSLRKGPIDAFITNLSLSTPESFMNQYLKFAIRSIGRPITIHAEGFFETTPAGHALVVYAFKEDDTGTAFRFYDPNHPFDPTKPQDSEKVLIFRNDLASFVPYEDDGLLFLNFGILNSTVFPREPFDTILAEAENDFEGKLYPYVECTSHGTGAILIDPAVTLQGKVVSSGLVKALQVQALQKNDTIVGDTATPFVEVADDGTFTIPPFSLLPGENALSFHARGSVMAGDIGQTPVETTVELKTNQEIEAEQELVLTLVRHIELSTSDISLTSDNPVQAITVSSVEPGESFPLQWTASSNDSRISVSPASETSNSEIVFVQASNSNENFNGTVTFSNGDNPADSQELNVNYQFIPPPPPPQTTFLQIDPFTTHRLSPAKPSVELTVYTNDDFGDPSSTPMRWIATSSDPRVRIVPPTDTSSGLSPTTTEILTDVFNGFYVTNVQFEDAANPDHLSVNFTVTVGDFDLRGSWSIEFFNGLPSGTITFGADDTSEFCPGGSASCETVRFRFSQVSATKGHLSFRDNVFSFVEIIDSNQLQHPSVALNRL